MTEKPSYEELERRFHELQKTESELKQIKDVLLEREEGYRTLIEFSPLPFLVTQEERIIVVNPAALNFLGIKDEGEIIGTSPGRWIHPDFIDLSYQRRCQVLENGKLAEIKELILIRKDAQEMTVLANTVRITHNGSPATLSVFQDITELKEIQDKLTESEALFRGMFKDHSAVMLLIDPNTGQIIKANQAATQFYGYSLEKMLQMKIQQFNTLSPAEVTKEMQSALNKQINIFEFQHMLADGQVRDVEVHSAPITIQHQTLLFSIIRDITDHKRTEETLLKSEERFLLAMKASNDGLFDWNLDTNDIYYSPAWKNMLGYEDHELPNDFSIWEKTTDPEDVKKSWELQQKLISKQIDRFVLEFKMKHKDGHWVDILSRAEALFNDSGKAVRIVGTHVDITERKRSDEELRRYEWIIEKEMPWADTKDSEFESAYGDVTEYNKKRLILDGVKKENLEQMAADVMALLDTSLAVYEANGDYAYGIFKSSWCQNLDTASFKLSGTNDVKKALACGKWLCHDNCWNDSAKAAIDSGKPVDIECVGGIRLYAVPVFAGNEIIGVVSIGYGNPPKDNETLIKLSKKYNTSFDLLRAKADAYKPRPDFIIELGKKRCQHMARMIGEIIESRLANENLRKSEARHSKMLANIGDVIVIIDHKGINRYKSPNIEKLFGWKPEEVVGASTWDNIHPDDIPFTRTFFEKMMNKPGDVRTTECRYRSKDGSYKWIEFTGTNLFHDPDIKGLLGNYQDITERKRVEKALIEKEALFRGLFDHMTSGSGIYEVRNDGSKGSDYIIRGFNRKSLEMEGKKLEEVMGKSLFDLRPNIDDYGLIPVMKKVWETSSPVYYPSKIYQDDSFSNYYENHIFKLPSGEIVTIYNDVTDKKKQEKDLQESEARFKALHNASFGGIAIHDKGVILESNQGLSEMTGYPVDELIGMDGLLLIAEKSRPAVMNKILSGYEKPYEAMGLRKNGEEFPMRLEARNIPYKGKQVRTVEFRDITDEKQAELEREKLQTQLTQAQKMESVGRLAGGVAHDFNNMLGVILGHAELALELAEENSDLYSDLKEIQTAAQRSADLTKQLLTFARKQIIEPKLLNLNQIVKQMITMLQRLIGEDIDLLWKPCEALWPIKMDPSQIDQILANLCVNARDAITDVGKITIETDMVSFDEAYCTEHAGFIPGDFVLLGVSDNGSGMDKETLSNLFEPFFTTKEMGKGTGLGLATVYGIVKQNKGFINVYSEPGQGSTFKICLPRHTAVDRTAPVIHTEQQFPGGNETILLVEDEPAILNMVRMMLERKGYSVLSAATPAEAIALAKMHADKIHLLITDVVMPEMNGRDLARHLIAVYPDVKLLFMSGYTANVIAHQGVLDEGVSFIQKPFSRADLFVKLRNVLDEATGRT